MRRIASAFCGWLAARPVAAGTRYDPARRRCTVPGSAWPLMLMMGIFWIKYAVAVLLAVQPALGGDLRLALSAGLLYGACSGAFAGRAMGLWRLAARSGRVVSAGAAPACGGNA